MKWFWIAVSVAVLGAVGLSAMPGLIPPWMDIVLSGTVTVLVLAQVFGYLLAHPRQQTAPWSVRFLVIRRALGPGFYPTIALFVLAPVAILMISAQLRCGLATDCGAPQGDMRGPLGSFQNLAISLLIIYGVPLTAMQNLVDWSALHPDQDDPEEEQAGEAGLIEEDTADLDHPPKEDPFPYRPSPEGLYLAGSYGLLLAGLGAVMFGSAGRIWGLFGETLAVWLLACGFVAAVCAHALLTWRLLRRPIRD